MSANQESVSTSREDRVGIVTFSPAEDGTISNKGATLLSDTLDTLIKDETVGAIVLRGQTPGVFIRHANVAQIERAANALVAGKVDEVAFTGSPFARLCSLLDRSPKPVIAAIDGICMGGGFEIALSCTMRVAANDVMHIGLPEIRIGIPPGAGGPQRLARIVGTHRAFLFALKGRVIDAVEAERMGIIDRLAPDAVAAAMEEATAFASRSPVALKELLRQMRPDDGAAIDENQRGFAHCLQATETRQAIADFLASGASLESLP